MNRNHKNTPKRKLKKKTFGIIFQKFPFPKPFPFSTSQQKKSKLSKTNNLKKLTCQRKEHFEGIWEKEN